MRDEISEIYDQLFALNLPSEAWRLIAKLNNLNMLHPDHIAADARRAKDRERKRVSKDNSTESTESTIILDSNTEGGVGETNSAIPRKPLDALAPVLGAELGRAVVEHRQKLRAPLTMRAAEQLAKRLKTFPDPKAAAEKMLEKGWKSIELDWMHGKGGGPPSNVAKGPWKPFKLEADDPPKPTQAEREAQIAKVLR